MTSAVSAEHADEADRATGETGGEGRQQREPDRVRQSLGDGRAARLVELLALLPALAMTIEVSRAPQLQMLDYWHVLLRITNPDGSLNLLGTRHLQNEHPLVLPSLFYWLDARIFDGDNRVLGYLTVVFALLTVLLLRAALPTSLPPMVRACTVVAGSAMAYSLHGLHNFALGMSGTAWLLANLLVVAALLLGMRGQWWAAWFAGLLASISYGTGFAVWPAFFVLATLNRDRWWKRLMPVGIGLVVAILWLLARPGVNPGATPASDPGTLLFTFLTVVGHLWTAGLVPGIAAIAGMGILLGYVGLLTTRAARSNHLRFWWALACHGLLASAMIGLARIDFGTDFGLSSRYASLSMLCSLPLLVILTSTVASVVRRRGTPRLTTPRIAIVVLAVGLLGFVLGAPSAASVRSALREVPLQAVAMRAGVNDALGNRLPPDAKLNPRLEAMGHYPFSEDFTLGCGGPEFGDKLDRAAMSPLPAADTRDKHAPAGWQDGLEEREKGTAVLIRGWAYSMDDPVKCAVYVDSSGTITGGGQYHQRRPDVPASLDWVPVDVGFVVIAPADPDGRVAIVLESGRAFWLPGTKPADTPPN